MKNKLINSLETLVLSTALISGCGNFIETTVPVQQTPTLQYNRDINGDRITDIITIGNEGRVIVEIGTEDHILYFPKKPYRVTFSDQNGDGYLDVLAHIDDEGEDKIYAAYQMQDDRGNTYFTTTHQLRTNPSR